MEAAIIRFFFGEGVSAGGLDGGGDVGGLQTDKDKPKHHKRSAIDLQSRFTTLETTLTVLNVISKEHDRRRDTRDRRGVSH